MSEQKKGNEGFKSIYGFIMTAIGFAIGIGSLWKFPYVVGNNGGAVFLFCYIVLILAIGVPLCLLWVLKRKKRLCLHIKSLRQAKNGI